jgi:hypothetical protein
MTSKERATRAAVGLVFVAALAPSRGMGAPSAAPAGDLATCQVEIRGLRGEAAAAELERRKNLPPKELFALGAADPTAEKALTPAIERLLAAAHLEQMSHTLECRTFACRVLLAPTHAEERRINAWQGPLQSDEEMRERTSGMGFHSGNPSKDPLSGVALSQREVYLALADPSGKRMPLPRPTPAPSISLAPLPANAAACAAERQALRAQIQAARADADAHLWPPERFEKGTPNPKLAEELRGHMVDKFGAPATAAMVVECRSLICRTQWKDAPPNWHNQFFREPWYRKMVDGMMVGRDVFMVMAPGPRADGMGFLETLVKKFEASAAPDDCARQFPATGILMVKFHLPKTGEPSEDGEAGRISAVYGDTLAGTPLATCLQEALGRTVFSEPLPALPVGGATLYHRFSFPRRAPAHGAP